MIFSSPLFLFLFLPGVLLIYLMLRGLRARNTWLLIASLVFYAWGELGFVVVLLVSVMVNFIIAIVLERQNKTAGRKRILALGVVGNLGLLVVFKYSNPVINLGLHIFGVNPLVTFNFFSLPLGISFFTFHALSYLIDVCRQKQRAASNPGDMALYVLFSATHCRPHFAMAGDCAATDETRTQPGEICRGRPALCGRRCQKNPRRQHSGVPGRSNFFTSGQSVVHRRCLAGRGQLHAANLL